MQNDLVRRLVKSGVAKTREVIQVLNLIDRGNYIAAALLPYDDSPKPIRCDQTISAPHMHAVALEEMLPYLKKSPGESVKLLDVGCGSGYLTAALGRWVKPRRQAGDESSILSRAGTVYGMDIHPQLVALTRENLQKNDSDLLESGTVQLRVGNGWDGWPEAAPFNAIHVGAAAESFPQTLAEQLAIGGVMVVPIGPKHLWQGIQRLCTVERVAATGDLDIDFRATSRMVVRYVPLIHKPGE